MNSNGIDISKDIVGFSWWIEDEDGERYYTIPTKQNNDDVDINIYDKKGYPYGLLLTGIYPENYHRSDTGSSCGLDWFNYPLETVSIQNVYPGFDDWLRGGPKVDWSNPVEGTYVNAIGDRFTITGTKATNPYTLYMYDTYNNMNDYNNGKTSATCFLGCGYIYRNKQ